MNTSFVIANFCFILFPCIKELKEKPGADVLLKCEGPKDVVIDLLEWSKPDLQSEDFVYYYRSKRPNESYQHKSFRGRVRLKDPEMKNGNVSVILSQVTLNDTGTYECVVGYSGRRPELICSITLKVESSGEFVKLSL